MATSHLLHLLKVQAGSLQVLHPPGLLPRGHQLLLLTAQLSQVTYNNNSRVWTNSNASKFCVSQWQSYTYILLSNVKSVRAVIIRPSRSYPSEPSFWVEDGAFAKERLRP